MNAMKVGIVGSGGIGLAYAAWISQRDHQVTIWGPRGHASAALRSEKLTASGRLEAAFDVDYAPSASELVENVDVILITVPVNAHRTVMDALAPVLRAHQTVIVSSMASLSSLYLYEAALTHGVGATVASFGTTALTARRKSPTHVDVMTQRPSVGVSCLPVSRMPETLALCETLLGNRFVADETLLVSSLANTNAITHVPLALFNWTRIELGENWPQYHFMTPHVAAVIEKLDAERLAIAKAFGVSVRSIEQHFSQSFKTEAEGLAAIAAELHQRRGGPPGPTDVNTRFLSEDVPFGIVFLQALGRLSGVATPTMDALTAAAALIVDQPFAAANDLLGPLRLSEDSVDGLLSRVNIP